MHVSFHDQFVMWYQNSYMMWCAGFFLLGGGGANIWSIVGFCGAVKIVHNDRELWR